jgi:hypothetical protein
MADAQMWIVVRPFLDGKSHFRAWRHVDLDYIEGDYEAGVSARGVG